MRKMISLGYAPATVRVLQKLMQQHDHGEKIAKDPWNSSNSSVLEAWFSTVRNAKQDSTPTYAHFVEN